MVKAWSPAVRTLLPLVLAIAAGWWPGMVEAEDEYSLDEVTVTAGRLADDRLADPAFSQTITAGDLAAARPATVAEALANTAGVVLRQYGGQGQTAIPRLLGSNRLVLLIDGQRVNMPLSGSNGLDLNQFIVGGNIDHIDVTLGGAAVEYGADAVGGVISLESARATKDGTSLDLSGGNLATGSVRLSAAGSEGKSSWQVSLASLAGSGQRPNSAYRTRNAALRWDQDLDSNRTLTVTGYLIDGYTRLPGSIYAPTAGDWQSGIWHNWSLTYASGKPDGNRQLFRCYTVSQSLSGLTGTPFADSNRLLGGQYRDAASLDADNLLSWGAEWLAESASGTGVGNNSFRRTNLDLFADNRQQLTDQVQLTYGARGSFSSQYGGYFLPQFTYLNNYSGHSSFFANLSRVFSPPTFLDLYGTDSYGNHGNPALRPEQGWTAETGWKTDHDGYFATYALFYRRIHDAIRWLPVDPDSPLSSWQPQNVDTLTAWGASLTARCQLSAVTAASAAYTWLQSFDQNGRTVGDPGNVASLSLTFREDRWQNTVTAAYTGPSGIAAQTVGGYLVVNTATSYRFDDRTTIYLVASNLLGRSYCPVFGYPADRLTARLGLDVRF